MSKNNESKIVSITIGGETFLVTESGAKVLKKKMDALEKKRNKSVLKIVKTEDFKNKVLQLSEHIAMIGDLEAFAEKVYGDKFKKLPKEAREFIKAVIGGILLSKDVDVDDETVPTVEEEDEKDTESNGGEKNTEDAEPVETTEVVVHEKAKEFEERKKKFLEDFRGIKECAWLKDFMPEDIKPKSVKKLAEELHRAFKNYVFLAGERLEEMGPDDPYLHSMVKPLRAIYDCPINAIDMVRIANRDPEGGTHAEEMKNAEMRFIIAVRKFGEFCRNAAISSNAPQATCMEYAKAIAHKDIAVLYWSDQDKNELVWHNYDGEEFVDKDCTVPFVPKAA